MGVQAGATRTAKPAQHAVRAFVVLVVRNAKCRAVLPWQQAADGALDNVPQGFAGLPHYLAIGIAGHLGTEHGELRLRLSVSTSPAKSCRCTPMLTT